VYVLLYWCDFGERSKRTNLIHYELQRSRRWGLEMKVAILGGASFIGKHLVNRFIRDGNEVTSFVRKKGIDKNTPIRNEVEFDFQDISSISKLLSRFDVVVHLVSSSNPASSRLDAKGDIQHNLFGTIDLLKTLENSPGTRLIFASSGGAVYGKPKSMPIAENHATDPVSPYGVSKLAIEKYLHISRLESGLDYKILRLSNPYGPLQVNNKGQGLIPTVIEKALKGESLTVWGDGFNTRDYVYIDDLEEAFVKAVEYTGDIRTFNVGSGVGSSVLEIVSAVSELIGSEMTIDFLPGRASDPSANVLDVRLASTELGWEPKTSLSEGLGMSVEWNRERLGL
jgi:UDP-glucose 4-epimerase